MLHKHFYSTGYWSQNQGRVTNVNIFSGLTPEDRMVGRTSGEDCGKQDGDYLSWTNSSWSLQGAARWTEVPVEDLCRQFSSIQWLSTSRVETPDHCEQLCKKLHEDGRMTSVETPELLERFKSRAGVLNPLLNPDGSNGISAWLPIKRNQNGTWYDIYTNKTISSSGWNEGFPINDSNKDCGIGSLGMVNWYCYTTGSFGALYCSCEFAELPF